MYFKRTIGTGEFIFDPVNDEVRDGKAGKGVNIQPDAQNKQDSEPDGDKYDVQDGGTASGTDLGSKGNGDYGLTTVT
jgi:hypothetical protein